MSIHESILPEMIQRSDPDETSSESSEGSEISDTSSVVPTKIVAGVDYNSDQIHEEVLNMLEASNSEIIQLISTDPQYYLGIVQNYNRMKDGREIYLPDLFNVLVNREGGRLKIKFKLSDNTQWYEVGFSGGDFDDQAVYRAFSEKVTSVLQNPMPSRREFLANTMKPDVSKPVPMVNQGNQNKLTKIDRFLGRTQPTGQQTRLRSPCPSPLPDQMPGQITGHMPELRPCPSPDPSQMAPQLPGRSQAQIRMTTPTLAPEASSGDMLNNVVQSFKDQLKARLHQGTSSASALKLPPMSDCPASKRDEYSRLLSILNSDSPFVKELVTGLPDLTPGQRLLMFNFLSGLQTVKSEAQLADQLGLSAMDRQLLSTYDIKLSEL